MKNLFFVIVLSLSFACKAQTEKELSIGKSYEITSGVLKEEREYYVYLPDDYDIDETKTYPVVYLLDAKINFHSYTGLQQMLSRGRRGGVIPKMIVVGIVNTNRTRDLTPVKAKNLPKKFQKNKKMLEESGGGEEFLKFLMSELRPEIEKKYRTSSPTTFVGHSFGGLTVLYTLLNYPNYFTNYLAIDPSIWWADEFLLGLAEEKLPTTDFLGKRLFFSSANHHHLRETQQELSSLFRKFQPKNLGWEFKNYPEENHGSVIIPSEYDGLKFLFQ